MKTTDRPQVLTTHMVRIEGTIQKIICIKPSNFQNYPWIIAEIKQDNGEIATVKGNATVKPELQDFLRAEFDIRYSSYGVQYETKSVIEILPPRSHSAIMTRMTTLAHSIHIRMNGLFKECILGLMSNDNVWSALALTTDPLLLDLQVKAEEYNRRYQTTYVSSIDVEGYLKDLGLTWTSKKIRKALGYEECEDPDRKPVTREDLTIEPFIMMDLVGISSSDVLGYLRCLINLNKIDESTLQIGLFLKGLMDEEGKQHTCMLIPASAEPYKTHPYYIKYITEYKGYMYRTKTFLKEHNVSSFVAERISSYPLSSLQSSTLDADLAALPPDQGKTPTEDQRKAVSSMFKEPMSMILGGAGTGKTTTLRLLCRYIQTYRPHMKRNILFLAPTGKAIQRIRESIANLKFCSTSDTVTIHRFVYVILNARKHVCGDKCQASTLGCTLSVPSWANAFLRQRVDDFPVADDTRTRSLQMIVLDEAFMIDLSTLNMFIHVLHSFIDNPKNMPHIAFIGDNAQLLPIGYGQPILDFERSGLVPIHRLQQIHRHAETSTLLSAINALRERKPFHRTDETYSFVPITETTLPRVLLDWVNAHPGTENAIIVPTNDLLNTITPILREHLNPVAVNPPIMNGPFEYKFRVGDKVMQTKNNSLRNVYNGTCGTILQFLEREKEMEVRFNDREENTLYNLDAARDELDLAYAFTTHKAQGSEYDHVLIIMNRPIPGFINRNLIYTGASRGKRSVTIALSNMNIRKGWRDLPAERRTNLVSMIDDKVEYSEELTATA